MGEILTEKLLLKWSPTLALRKRGIKSEGTKPTYGFGAGDVDIKT